jgi:hypothetical protein
MYYFHNNSISLNFISLDILVRGSKGRAIGEAVSRWLPIAAARVRARVWKVGFEVDEVALGQVCSEYFGFPCQSSFHQILHLHSKK